VCRTCILLVASKTRAGRGRPKRPRPQCPRGLVKWRIDQSPGETVIFRLRIINPASTSTSGHIRPTITTERLDFKPRNEAKEKQKHKKKKTKLLTKNPTKRQNIQRPSSQTAIEAGHMSSKATPSRRKWRCTRHRCSSEEPEKGFHLEDRDQAGSIPTTPPRRTTTPEDAAVVDTDQAGRAFARRFVQCRPDDEERWTATPAAIIKGARGEQLAPPNTPTTNDMRFATPCPPRGKTDTDREGPDLQGGHRGAEATRSSRQPTPTPCCTPVNLCYT
jgi:hypothetical protein